MTQSPRVGGWLGWMIWGMGCLLPGVAQALLVSEIHYHPSDPRLEFIELHNDRAVFEDMGHWRFTDGIAYEFPAGFVLAGKSLVVIAADPNAVAQVYGLSHVLGPYSGSLSNSGEHLELCNETGGVVLSLDYADRYPWTAIPDGTGHSLVRSRFAGDPEEPGSWTASLAVGGDPGRLDPRVSPVEPPTTWKTWLDVGSPGRYFKGTQEPSPAPDGSATTAWTQVDFRDDPIRTDWRDGPSGYGYSNNDAELAYIQTQLNDMRGNYLSVYVRLPFTLSGEDLRQTVQWRATVVYDDAYVLYLNGTRIAASDRLPQTPPAFDQDAGPGSDPAPAELDLTGFAHLLREGTNILALQVHNASLSGSSDCIAAVRLQSLEQAETSVTSVPGDDGLRINEVFVENGGRRGWIELTNCSDQTLSLADCTITDDPGDLFKVTLPPASLQPGDFTVFSFDETSPLTLVAGRFVAVTRSTAGATRVLDALHIPPVEPGLSWGRWPDGENRITALSQPSQGQRNPSPWRSPVVINEIMYHHLSGEDRYDYVELLNRGGTPVDLAGWELAEAVRFTFPPGTTLPPDGTVVIGQDPDTLAGLYPELQAGTNLFGPYDGRLSHAGERLVLTCPLTTGRNMLADEVTYYDGGLWPEAADGRGSSLELRDPNADNDDPGAWAASDETGKSTWRPFEFSVSSSDSRYTHDAVNLVDLMLLGPGEVLLDDLECRIDGQNVLANGDFEDGDQSWRFLGNHRDSRITLQDAHGGQACLHLVASGRGDPGGNRINQSIGQRTARSVTLRGWARWLSGCPFLLMRTVRTQAPVQPPRPAHAFTLEVPAALGTPGRRNSQWLPNRGPSITQVTHHPVIPADGDPILVTARIHDDDGIVLAAMGYRTEGGSDSDLVFLVDDGTGPDTIAQDGIYSGVIPGASAGTLRSFTITTTDGHRIAQYPPDGLGSCLVRVADTPGNTALATYRLWIEERTVDTFRGQTNLSNQLWPCTFVYNDREVFYHARFRLRGSPWLRPGSGWSPLDRHAYRVEFPSHQRFRHRTEINLDNTEVSRGGGPLQERASYWFYRKMGLPYSRQEFVRVVLNGRLYGSYEDVQKVDGDYLERWFPGDADGYLYEIDDYFEYDAAGTSQRNLDEGIRADAQHPPLKETYRWEVEKRSHRENDNWDGLFDFAAALNTPAQQPDYVERIEAICHPEQFAAIFALCHMVGNWDTYGYRRGKNCMLYHAPVEDKWYLLPWDIDFTLGSGDGANSSLPATNGGIFPEVAQFLQHDRYEQVYWEFLRDLVVAGPWRTSYGTQAPPTDFDRFLDDSAAVLEADGQGTARRDAIKRFVRDRRNYVLNRLAQRGMTVP